MRNLIDMWNESDFGSFINEVFFNNTEYDESEEDDYEEYKLVAVDHYNNTLAYPVEKRLDGYLKITRGDDSILIVSPEYAEANFNVVYVPKKLVVGAKIALDEEEEPFTITSIDYVTGLIYSEAETEHGKVLYIKNLWDACTFL